MRYPYYRYQFGGAGTEEAKGPEPTIESITTEQAQDYEQKNWLQGWHVHNPNLVAPSGDKETFVKQRVLNIQKKLAEAQKKKQESLTSISGVKAAKSKKGEGLLSIGRKAILEGRKTVDAMTRFSGRLRDSVFGSRSGRGSRSRSRGRSDSYYNPYGRSSSRQLTQAQIDEQARLRRARIRRGNKGKTKKKRKPIKGENNSCTADKDCGNSRLHCKIIPSTPKGIKSGVCKRKTCKIYSNSGKCGSHHVCLPKRADLNYIPLEDDESTVGESQENTKNEKKLDKNLTILYQQISAIRIRMLRYEDKLFKGDEIKAFQKSIESIAVTTDGERKFKSNNTKEISRLEDEIKEDVKKLNKAYGQDNKYSGNNELDIADVYYILENLKGIALQRLQVKNRKEYDTPEKRKTERERRRLKYKNTIDWLNKHQTALENDATGNTVVLSDNIIFSGLALSENILDYVLEEDDSVKAKQRTIDVIELRPETQKKSMQTDLKKETTEYNRAGTDVTFKESIEKLRNYVKSTDPKTKNINIVTPEIFKLRKEIEAKQSRINFLKEEDIHKYLNQKREDLRKIQPPSESSLIQHTDAINKLYTDKEKEIFNPLKILQSYRENLTANYNKNSFFKNLKINATYQHFDKAYLGDGKGTEDFSSKKYQDNSYIGDRSTSRSNVGAGLSLAGSIKFNKDVNDFFYKVYKGIYIDVSNAAPVLAPILVPLFTIVTAVFNLIAKGITISYSIIIGVLSMIFTPYRFARVMKYQFGYGRRIDKYCEKLYFLSYIKHCSDEERKKITESIKDTLNSFKKERTGYSISRYNQRPIKKSRLKSILKRANKDGFDNYKLKNLSKKSLFKMLWLTHFFYPNEYLREEIENIELPELTKQKYHENLVKKYNVQQNEEKYQGYNFSVIKGSRETYYENKIKALKIENSMKYTFAHYNNQNIEVDQVLKIFDVSKANNIFNEFLELNMRINSFVKEMNEKYAALPSSTKLILNEDQQKLLFAITKKDSMKKSDVSVLIQYNIRKTFGMNEEVGLMKRYLFSLFDIIQYNNEITFDTDKVSMSGGANENSNNKEKEVDFGGVKIKIKGEKIISGGKKLLDEEKNVYILVEGDKKLISTPNFPLNESADEYDLNNNKKISNGLVFKKQTEQSEQSTELYVQGNKVYTENPDKKKSEEKLKKKLTPKEVKIAKSINSVKLLGMLKSRNPLLFRRNDDTNKPTNNQIKMAYELLFNFYSYFLKKEKFQDKKGSNNLFYNNILSFLEFMVKIREVGSLVFQLNSSGILEIRKNISLQEKIKSLIDKRKENSLIDENILFTSTQKTQIKPELQKEIITLANAFVVKYTLDFNKNYLNEQDNLDVDKTDRFLQHFLDFLKQLTPNLHTVRFYEEFAGDENFLKLVISQKETLLELLKTNFEDTINTTDDIEFEKIDKIFMDIKFNNYGKIQSIFGEKFKTSTLSARDIISDKSKIQEEISSYIRSHCILQGIDFSRDNLIQNIEASNNLDSKEMKILLNNIKKLDTSFKIQTGGVDLATLAIADTALTGAMFASEPGNPSTSKKSKKQKEEKEKKEKDKKDKKDEIGFCWPRYGDCNLYPEEMHSALIPKGETKKGFTSTYKTNKYKSFFKEEDGKFDEKTKIQKLKTESFVDFYLNIIFDNKIPAQRKTFNDQIDEKINEVVTQEPELKKFLRMIKDIKNYLFDLGPSKKLNIEILLYAMANKETFEREFKEVREEPDSSITENIMMDELLKKSKTKNNMTEILSAIHHEFNVEKDLPAELNLKKLDKSDDTSDASKKESIKSIFKSATDIPYKLGSIIPANMGYKNLSTIPKIDNDNFYTFEQAFEFYIKIKYYKEKKPENSEASIEECKEYEIKNLSREANIDVNNNPIFEDFVFYQLTIFNSLKKNIKDELLKLNQESKNFINNIKTVTEYYKDITTNTSVETLDNIQESIIQYQETVDNKEPTKFKSGERSSLRLEKIIDLCIQEFNTMDEGGVNTENSKKFINNMTNSNIISNISKIRNTISTEKTKSAKYYVKLFGTKYYFQDLNNLENIKRFINEGKEDTLTFMDIVFLCQNVYKIDGDTDINCKFSLLDIMIKNPKQFYDYILLKELYGYRFTGDILKDTQNKSIKIQSDGGSEKEIYLPDVEEDGDSKINLGLVLFMYSNFKNSDNKSKITINQNFSQKHLKEIYDEVVKTEIGKHEFLKIYNLNVSEDISAKINIKSLTDKINENYTLPEIFDDITLPDNISSIKYTDFLDYIKTNSDTPLFSLFDSLEQGEKEKLTINIKKNIINSIVDRAIEHVALEGIEESKKYSELGNDVSSKLSVTSLAEKELEKAQYKLLENKLFEIVYLYNLFLSDNSESPLKGLTFIENNEYYDNNKIQIQKIINEILNPIQESFKSKEAGSLGNEKKIFQTLVGPQGKKSENLKALPEGKFKNPENMPVVLFSKVLELIEININVLIQELTNFGNYLKIKDTKSGKEISSTGQLFVKADNNVDLLTDGGCYNFIDSMSKNLTELSYLDNTQTKGGRNLQIGGAETEPNQDIINAFIDMEEMNEPFEAHSKDTYIDNFKTDETLKAILEYRKQEYEELKSLNLDNEIKELVGESEKKQNEYLKIQEIKQELSKISKAPKKLELPSKVKFTFAFENTDFSKQTTIEKCIIRLLLLIGYKVEDGDTIKVKKDDFNANAKPNNENIFDDLNYETIVKNLYESVESGTSINDKKLYDVNEGVQPEINDDIFTQQIKTIENLNNLLKQQSQPQNDGGTEDTENYEIQINTRKKQINTLYQKILGFIQKYKANIELLTNIDNEDNELKTYKQAKLKYETFVNEDENNPETYITNRMKTYDDAYDKKYQNLDIEEITDKKMKKNINKELTIEKKITKSTKEKTIKSAQKSTITLEPVKFFKALENIEKKFLTGTDDALDVDEEQSDSDDEDDELEGGYLEDLDYPSNKKTHKNYRKGNTRNNNSNSSSFTKKKQRYRTLKGGSNKKTTDEPIEASLETLIGLNSGLSIANMREQFPDQYTEELKKLDTIILNECLEITYDSSKTYLENIKSFQDKQIKNTVKYVLFVDSQGTDDKKKYIFKLNNKPPETPSKPEEPQKVDVSGKDLGSDLLETSNIQDLIDTGKPEQPPETDAEREITAVEKLYIVKHYLKIDFDFMKPGKTTPGKPENKILDEIYLGVANLLRYLDLDERLKIIFPDFTAQSAAPS